MIQLSAGAPIVVINEPISFQKRLKGMLALCRDVLEVEPMDGGYFVFRNRDGTMIRVMFYDGDGFWLCEKVFSQGRVRCWYSDGEKGISEITARELSVLLWHGNPLSANFAPYWKKVG